MKKMIFLLIIGGAILWFYRFPDILFNPTYAEIHMMYSFEMYSAENERSERIIFFKALNKTDCEIQSKELLNNLDGMTVISRECKPELPPQYAKVFDNEPISVPYLSLRIKNREVRVLFYDVDVAESDMTCDLLSEKMKDSGDAACIHAIR
jgi:hypothetical protein